MNIPAKVRTVWLYVGLEMPSLPAADINECQTDNGGCTQTCDNTDGSYQCSCIEGYELTDDGHSCTGRSQYKYSVQPY